MPCHPARARELVRAKKAMRRFNHGIFYIRLIERCGGETQEIAIGIDPGSKHEAFSVKSADHTYLNIQTSTPDWVKNAINVRKVMRLARRRKRTPYRQPRWNRKSGLQKGKLPPSTLARWQWKLRIAKWLTKIFPVSHFVVEDIKAHTFGGKKWNVSFSPLQQGKRWLYSRLTEIADVTLKQGWETKEMRDAAGLRKSKDKMAEIFDAHCVDSWVLANSWTGGHIKSDNVAMLLIDPLRFHRRQLHAICPGKGGIRRPYGGTRSLGFKRGSLVKHRSLGVVFVGGSSKGKIALHDLNTGKRIMQFAKQSDIKFLTYNSWRWRVTTG